MERKLLDFIINHCLKLKTNHIILMCNNDTLQEIRKEIQNSIKLEGGVEIKVPTSPNHNVMILNGIKIILIIENIRKMRIYEFKKELNYKSNGRQLERKN